MKGLTPKQAEYKYGKCQNEGIIGSEQVYECESNDKQQFDLKLNLYECAILKTLNYTMFLLKVLK